MVVVEVVGEGVGEAEEVEEGEEVGEVEVEVEVGVGEVEVEVGVVDTVQQL